MREAVIGQISFFGASVLFGGILLAVYDVIRGIRRTWVHKSSWVAAEDLIFWLFVGIASFVFLCRYNQGQLRGFFFWDFCWGWQCITGKEAVLSLGGWSGYLAGSEGLRTGEPPWSRNLWYVSGEI